MGKAVHLWCAGNLSGLSQLNFVVVSWFYMVLRHTGKNLSGVEAALLPPEISKLGNL